MNTAPNTQHPISIAYGTDYAKSEVWGNLKSTLIIPTEIDSFTAAQCCNPALILLDQHLVQEMDYSAWVQEFPDSIFLCNDSMDLDADLILTANLPYRQTCKLLEMACYQWVLKGQETEHANLRDTNFRYLNKLADIGISLSSEDDLMTLLMKILNEGQNIACCDAASLFLINEFNDRERDLLFRLTKNDSMEFPFEEMRFPLDDSSIAGYVALTDSALNIPDAYQIPDTVPYKFNRSFDQNTGYRTKSVFAIPFANKQKEVIGVLEFINRKKARSLKIIDEKSAAAYTLPFDSDINILLRALASQAGIAIENTILQNDIKALFEGFVNASVAAIEQRDPTTSGHSFRVADLCVELAGSVSASNISKLRDINFSVAEVRELRYAALLHDFGKVGVRESVLVKEKKLTEGSLNNIQYRILLAQERLKSEALSKQLTMYRNGNVNESEMELINAQLALDSQMLNVFYADIVQANEPSILNRDNREMLKKINAYGFNGIGGELTIISAEELNFLSINKGNLSASERKEIESHVVHTQNFLNHIPWTKEFKNIPTIAGKHHEKLNGSGYPLGITAAQIPTASKIMTICDIYDALTASDRPYKPAMNAEAALDVLQQESKQGFLDGDLVQVFIEAKVFRCIDSKKYSTDAPSGITNNHPCDPDLH
ncbi:MAG: GAF domain-containing protein [Pseudohongiella sp.]|nr:GAF domain-containing protein [Pseudohongiella sp.]